MDTKAFVENTVSRALDKYLELHPDGGGAAIQVSTLPEASVEEEGKIYQFIGATTAEYTNGYFYECVEILPATDPKTYQWVQKDVQPGGASGDYRAGQGIRIQNAVIDTPLLDNNYIKYYNQDVDTFWPFIGRVYKIDSTNRAYLLNLESGKETDGNWDNTVSTKDFTPKIFRDNFTTQELGNYSTNNPGKVRLCYISKDGQNWELLEGWSTGSGSGIFGTFYKFTPINSGWSGYTLMVGDAASNFSIVQLESENEMFIRIEEIVTTTTQEIVHQVSGIVKEDYYDEWFTDLTEQDVHQGVEHAFTQGAVTIQEQYSVGEEVLIGTWKENNVVYDLYRKVIDFGALPNASIKSVDTGIVGGVKMVYANVSVYHSVTALGYGIYNSGSLYDWTMCTLDKIHIRTETDKSAMSATVVIEYTKARG